MRRIVALSVIFLLIMCVPGIAGALTITFDEFGPATNNFLQTTALRDEYAQQPYNYGVHFIGPGVKDGGAILSVSAAPISPLGPCNSAGCSGGNALSFNSVGIFASESGGGKPIWPETISFDGLWKTVSIWVAPQDQNALTRGGTFSLLAYDMEGTLVADWGKPTSIISSWTLLSVSWEKGIKKVELIRTDGGNSFTADDLQLTGQMPVPEPGTMLLLGLGLIGLSVLRKRN
jgi:hypothetical protein